MATAARAYLLVGLIGIALYIAIGGSHAIYELYGSAAVVAILVGVARNRPANRLGWTLLAASQLALNVADFLYWTVYGGAPSFPSPADVLYLVGALIFILALYSLVNSGTGAARDLMSLADAAVLSLAIGLFLWSTFFSGALGDGAGVARVVSVAYPVLDLVLLTMLIRVLLGNARRTSSYLFVVASVLFVVLSDAWYVVPALTNEYVAGTWRDGGWLASYLFAGVAALRPTMRVFIVQRSGPIPVRRVILLGSSLVLVAVAACVSQALTGDLDVYAFGAFGGGMAAFITIRVVGLVRTLERTRVAAETSERRFRMIFERSPVGISVGRDGVMSETNPALQRMLGYTGAELARMHYTQVTHSDDRELTEQLELDSGARNAFAIDKRYTRRDGTPLDAHVNVALDIEEGIGISLIEDVTDRRHLEDQLRQAQKMESIGKLAGGIAHDFNNLMTAVIGYSDLLAPSVARDDNALGKVEAIRDSAVRASDLTRQLLAFSRRQIMQTQEIDLRDVVERMDSLLRRLIGEDVRLQTLFGSEPVLVRADRTQLEQVVMNLAVNARDAMPDGGTLTVAVVSAGDTAVLSVNDDGIGMDDTTRARIFEPFFTTKPLVESSGLGLSTVHGIVGQTGGSIDVRSEPGRGATFTIRLPAVAATAVAAPAVAATVVPATAVPGKADCATADCAAAGCATADCATADCATADSAPADSATGLHVEAPPDPPLPVEPRLATLVD
jgi:PAS domain S-box-containing protein